MRQRSIAVCILLSIVTCGIYGYYWMAQLNNEINYLSGRTNAASGGMVVLFSLLTCGLYTIYWYYKMGDIVDWLRTQRGEVSGNMNILCLIMGVLGLGIVSMAFLQDEVNRYGTPN